MTVEAVSFAIGGILIATAIVGGGFEIKEIKMPRVGAGPRFFSLIVGVLFVMIGFGTWSFDRQHLLAVQPVTNSLVPVGSGSAAEGETVSRSAPAQPAAEQRQVAAGQPQHATPQELLEWEEPQFNGFTGKARLSWSFDGVPYNAYIETNGSGGVLRVAYDSGEGYVEEVDQDLVLQYSEGIPYYQGMNPRYAATQQPFADYLPDALEVARVDRTSWTFARVCSQGTCEPINTTEVLP